MQRIGLQEIRERTYKRRDAWWTVLLVDPLASRLVRLVAPYRWITPNLLSAIAFVFGIGSAVCFALGTHAWLAVGALLFHLSFVVDCMDGKIARLNGTGSMFGAWFDFMFDRVRVIMCTVALMGGQYARTHDLIFLWLAVAVVTLDLFRYLNSSQMGKLKRAMDGRLAEARGEAPGSAVPGARAAAADAELADDEADPADTVEVNAAAGGSRYIRLRNWLNARRIRIHLFSGIEYEMSVFIIGPLVFQVALVTIAAGALLLLFEAALVMRLYQATRRFQRQLRKIEASAPHAEADVPDPRAEREQVSAGH
ncbi:CDP-alcohol phosphatidyltransferase family protein [Mangrovihabitans endophyticus]|uniref:CDP-alcohol phosphatidyltransferase n=1 Tax=Mangrovihabitans endophyticus TaxID=1751298 RepID=A0A8J3BX43_9ACTN|nr:CDP-alcohol phosphatidyltransferase family protein [Mangrovihabitans endophyticus]GGK83048.1 hypothetical protein GCM10012284_16470 [Mangrovihabitans endophyticus]